MNAHLVGITYGIITAVAGVVGILFLITTQACMKSGGCLFMTWIYMFIYVAVLLAMIFLTVAILYVKYKEENESDKTETRSNDYSGTDSKFLGNSDDPKSFIQRRMERIRHMLHDRRTNSNRAEQEQ